MGKLSDNLRHTLLTRLSPIESQLQESREWIEKLESAGFNVADLKSKQAKAENTLERVRTLT